MSKSFLGSLYAKLESNVFQHHKILYRTFVFLLFFPDLSSFALFKMALNVSVDMRVETWILIGDSLAVKWIEKCTDLQSHFTKLSSTTSTYPDFYL